MSTESPQQERVLVIKLGALGDVIQALGPIKAIRERHNSAHITCMTTAPFHDLLAASSFFDTVWTDRRPRSFDVSGWLEVRRFLRQGGFTRVYDLQTSGRTNRYYASMWPGPYPQWSGIAPGCSHRHANPNRDDMHTVDRQREQLELAGIKDVPAPSLEGLGEKITHFDVPERYCLIVPGGAEHRPEKRWPASKYRELLIKLADAGQRSVVIGTATEERLASEITDGIKGAVSAAGKTSLRSLVTLAKNANIAIGNDSGPMHIAAVSGIPTVVLYSHASDPALCAQRGADVTILRRPSLSELGSAEVWDALPKSGP